MVDGLSVRKLWTARILFVLAAGGLGAVVIEEQREQQAADREPLRTICQGQYDAPGNAERPGPAQRGCADFQPARAPKSR
jgi:hypothetical protein